MDVKDEGTLTVSSVQTLDFVGAGVTATDGTGGKVTVTIPAGGGAAADDDDNIIGAQVFT